IVPVRVMVVSPQAEKPHHHALQIARVRHLYFAQIRHYYFAATSKILINYVMSNNVDGKLASALPMRFTEMDTRTPMLSRFRAFGLSAHRSSRVLTIPVQ
ncbi:hypothetical protein, partial [Paraburkholderia atlantica]|uniref:hypothetical protein n=1 Tax=Paraburkholderia atlantica TaxID=2654982 RepID=UPI001C377D00